MIDPINLRTFPPVEPLSEVPENLRQTLITKFTECPRSAWLYMKYGGGSWTHPLAGGTLLHRTLERMALHMIEHNEPTIPAETAKDILNEVLVESTDLTVGADRFDDIRAMVYNVARGWAINPSAVVCVETPVELDVNGRRVTGQIDFAEMLGPTKMLVVDFKSAFYHVARSPQEDEYVPTQEEWAGSLQMLLYALALADGSIEGSPFGFEGVQEFELRQIHPRTFWEREGTFAYKRATITRDALLDWRFYIEAVVESFEQALRTWEFPAVQGSHCDFCPSSAECPIPAQLRNFRGEIRTAEDAVRAAMIWERTGQRRSELWDALKGYVKQGHKVRYGKDLVLEHKTSKSERVKQKAVPPGAGTKKIKGITALRSAIDITERFGIPVIWEDYVDKSVSTRLSRRKLTDAELTKERESTP